jgi:hypothetical protein
MIKEQVVLPIQAIDIWHVHDISVILKSGIDLSDDTTDFRPHSFLRIESHILKPIVDKSFEHRNI